MYFSIEVTLRGVTNNPLCDETFEIGPVTVGLWDTPGEEVEVESFKFPECGTLVEAGPLFDASMKMLDWDFIYEAIQWRRDSEAA